MKTIFTFLPALICIISFGQDKSTVADGDWYDPFIWSPVGVPLSESNVVVNHDIVFSGTYVEFGADWFIVSPDASVTGDSTFALHGNLRLLGLMDVQVFAVGDGDSTNIYGELTGEKSAFGNPSNINFGILSTDTVVTGEYFENYGVINTVDLTSGGPAFENRAGAEIWVTGMCLFSGYVQNELTATIQAIDLITEGTVVNNGEIATTNWTHGSGIANGTTGKFCISDCFVNADEISGTVDVCDATPGTFCDFNFGSIAPTVTLCGSGPCIGASGVDESTSRISVFPNPATDVVTITNVPQGGVFSLFSLQGTLIYDETTPAQGNMHIDVRELESGVYVLKMLNGNVATSFRIIKS